MTAEPVPTSTPPPKERMTAPWATSDPSPTRATPSTTAEPAICNEPAFESLSALPGPALIISIMPHLGRGREPRLIDPAAEAREKATCLFLAGILRSANLVASGRVSREIGRVMILVIGGRSKIGSAVLDHLGRQGASVRALARSSEPSAAFRLPIETVSGDLGDPASLEAAMQGAE